MAGIQFPVAHQQFCQPFDVEFEFRDYTPMEAPAMVGNIAVKPA